MPERAFGGSFLMEILMPWEIYEADSEYCVHKVTEDGNKGEKEGCHATKDEAKDQLAALNASENEEKAYVPYDVESFDELDEQRITDEKMERFRTDVQDFQAIIENISYSAGATFEEKANQIVFVANDLSQRIKENFDKTDETKEIEQQEGLIEKIVKAVKGAFQSEEPQKEGLVVFKDTNGDLRWLSKYSNNKRDKEYEIITSDSHKRFVKMVDSGKVEMPELLLWHEPEWVLGKADLLDYDDSGYAIASGTFNDASKSIAKWLGNVKGLRTSHGMPTKTIKRDKEDPNLIVEHETREISVLPKRVAANELTGFYVINKQEDTMAMSKNKKDKLEQLGVTAETLDGLESFNEEEAALAEEAGIDSKEVDEEQSDEEKKVNEDEQEERQEDTATKQDVVEALEMVVEGYNKKLVELATNVDERFTALEEVIDKSVEKRMTDTPPASIAGMLAKKMSVVGNEETKVDGRTTLAKNGPEEAEAKSQGKYPVPFLNDLANGGK